MDPAHPWTGFWLKNLVYGLYCSWPGRALRRRLFFYRPYLGRALCLALYLDKYAWGFTCLWALPRPLIWMRVPFSSCVTLMDEYALGSFNQIIGSTSSFDLDEGALILLYP